MEKLNIQNICGKEIPMKCDNYVLAMIQEEYGTLNNFEMKLLGLTLFEINGVIQKDEKGKSKFIKGEPSIKAINFALPIMISEGYAYAKDIGNTTVEEINIKRFMRELNMNIEELAVLVHDEFTRAFDLKN